MAFDLNLIQLLRNQLEGVPLRLQLWDGRKIDLSSHPKITLILNKPASLRYLLYPTLYSIGSGYIENEIQFEGDRGDLHILIDSLTALRLKKAKATVTGAALRALLRLQKLNPLAHRHEGDSKVVRFHYDVSDEFFKLWLDHNLVYSSGYFENENDSLDVAQDRKLDYVCRKLMLAPGEKLLEIGCGWGGLLRWAVQKHDVRATGITSSRHQYEFVTAMIKREKLERNCKVLLCDYRDLHGQGGFDKIVSLGMSEQVGLAQFPRYFKSVHDLLRPNGLFLNQAISIQDREDKMEDWSGSRHFLSHYIFPEGEPATLDTVEAHMRHYDLELADVENLRPHYAKTLTSWADRLAHHAEEARVLAGERRFRIWTAYLNGCAVAFDRGWISIYQTLSFRKTARGTWPLPWTRDHLYERKMAAAQAA